MTDATHPVHGSEPPSQLRTAGSASVLRLGAIVSVIQSALFVVIGVAALTLGVERLVDAGFASLASADPAAFRVLCGAFILIAVLGLAITPAERALIEHESAGWAGLGARLAYLGHAGTIAFFSWWLLNSYSDLESPTLALDTVAPIEFGVMFELAFVGAWVWILAGVAFGRLPWHPGFLTLSVLKATSFWFAFAAFLANEEWMLVLGVGAVAFVTGPSWHLWIARMFLRGRSATPGAR